MYVTLCDCITCFGSPSGPCWIREGRRVTAGRFNQTLRPLTVPQLPPRELWHRDSRELQSPQCPAAHLANPNAPRRRPAGGRRGGGGNSGRSAARPGGMAAAATALALGGGLLLAAWRWLRGSARAAAGPGASMRGKTVIITGANSGLGRAAAAELLRMRARVIMGCRDRARAERAASEIRAEVGERAEGGGELVVRELDLASLRSVRAFCHRVLQVRPGRLRARGSARRVATRSGGFRPLWGHCEGTRVREPVPPLRGGAASLGLRVHRPAPRAGVRSVAEPSAGVGRRV